MPFAVFQMRLTGSHEFIGVVNVRHRALRDLRVTAGTEP